MAIKVQIGKLPAPANVSSWLPQGNSSNGFIELPTTHAHAASVETLPLIHRDPFGRLLIAQARVDGLTIVTEDPVFVRYPVALIQNGAM